MSEVLFDLLGSSGEPAGRINGVAPARVMEIADPDGLGRVRLLFPWLSQQSVSPWARIAAPFAGEGIGAAFQPAIGDEVLVAFEHGDIRFPYVLGFLWSQIRRPPAQKGGDGSIEQVIKSRSGHIIRLVDTPEQGMIEIADSSGNLRVVLDTAAKKISITGVDIQIAAEGQLTLTGEQVVIQARGSAIISASEGLDANTNGPLRISGATVDIN